MSLHSSSLRLVSIADLIESVGTQSGLSVACAPFHAIYQEIKFKEKLYALILAININFAWRIPHLGGKKPVSGWKHCSKSKYYRLIRLTSSSSIQTHHLKQVTQVKKKILKTLKVKRSELGIPAKELLPQRVQRTCLLGTKAFEVILDDTPIN